MKGIIEISNLNDEGIVIEGYEKFNESAFGFVYQRAGKLLEDIVRKARQKEKEYEVQIDNIISFEGRRGTGKTSAMMSIRNALKNYEKVGTFIPGEDGDSVSFTVIDYIDASMLEKGEEILEIVLANMFSLLTNEDQKRTMQERSSYENRELYRLFDEIYGNLMGIKNREARKSEISPLSLLTQLSSSQVLKSKLRELIQQYLKYMGRNGSAYGRSGKHFLVIAIDDLDMHFQSREGSPFEMLETLHRYLMIPGVIILLTYNYYDLFLGCEKHFCQIYHEKKGGLSEKEQKHAEELTVDYLKKVLPTYSRIHMPSQKKRDYSEEDNIRICMNRKDTEKVLEKFSNYLWSGNNSERILLNPKKFILLLKASVADLYYDSAGKKRHFAEPSDLRELAQTYTFYSQLNELSKKGQEPETALFKEILDDLYFRFAKVKLLPEEEERFECYLNVPLERRSEDIMKDLRKIAEQNDTVLSQISYRSDAEESYSYGELSYGLYNASSKGWFSKQLMWCILDSYTIMLTKLYRKMKNVENEKDKAKYKRRLLKVVGASVSSSWSNLMVPMLQSEESFNEASIVNERDYRVLEKSKKISRAAAIKYAASTVKWTVKLENFFDINFQENQLQLLEVLCMFYTQVYHKDSKGAYKPGFAVRYQPRIMNLSSQYLEVDSDMRDKPEFQIEFSNGCFNIMNFVNNLFAREDFFDQLHKSLKEAYLDYYSALKKNSQNKIGDPEEEVEKLFKKHSLQAKYKKWYDKTDGMAMPIYSFDMMYNILKRQYQNRGRMPKAVMSGDFWKYVSKVYEDIALLLKAEDEFYFSNSEDQMAADNVYHFYDAYKKCPFLDCIDKFEKNNAWKVLFEEHFENMVLTIAQTW